MHFNPPKTKSCRCRMELGLAMQHLPRTGLLSALALLFLSLPCLRPASPTSRRANLLFPPDSMHTHLLTPCNSSPHVFTPIPTLAAQQQRTAHSASPEKRNTLPSWLYTLLLLETRAPSPAASPLPRCCWSGAPASQPLHRRCLDVLASCSLPRLDNPVPFTSTHLNDAVPAGADQQAAATALPPSSTSTARQPPPACPFAASPSLPRLDYSVPACADEQAAAAGRVRHSQGRHGVGVRLVVHADLGSGRGVWKSGMGEGGRAGGREQERGYEQGMLVGFWLGTCIRSC